MTTLTIILATVLSCTSAAGLTINCYRTINNNVPREEVNHVEVGHPVPHNDEENEEERISDTEIDIKINIHADKKDHHTFHIERGE